MKKIFLFIFTGIILTGCSAQASENIAIHETQTTTQKTLEQTKEKVMRSVKVPVFMFHYVRVVDKTKDPLGYNLSIDPVDFEKMLQYMQKNNMHTLHIEDALKGNVPSNPVILTFDDGYKDFYTTAYPLLEKYHFTASSAIITGKLDGNQYMTPDNVKELYTHGFEILSHTVSHPDLSKAPNALKEVTDSKNYLEKLLGIPVLGFVYPSGKYNQQTIQYLQQDGYNVAFTTQPGIANFSSANIYELPRLRIDNRDGLNGFIKKLTTAEAEIN